ncbi:MAG: DUF4293 domain-containing protein [Prevotella sp.]
MIQRKQTLYILAAVILTIVCLCLPLGFFNNNTEISAESILYNLWIVSPDGAHNWSVWALFGIQVVTCAIAVVAIFSYHNRIVQSRYCLFNILLLLGWHAVLVMYVLGLKDSLGAFKPSLTAIFPLISIILYIMARKAILADEALVRAADRIR